ncbi:MAG: hypothetical protein ACU833_00960 [Gammaproteobacteria bacterium]
MSFSLRRNLIFLLALLQLAAPLVHAHTGKESFLLGIHLPGLENIGGGNGEKSLNAASLQSEAQGIVIGVSSGIQLKNFSLDLSPDLWIHKEIRLLGLDAVYFRINFPPPHLSSNPRHHYNPRSPRAPPVSGLYYSI